MSTNVALVTGAASGLGRATALALGRAGATVCLVDRALEGLEETASLLRSAGGEAMVHVADLSAQSSCAEAVTTAFEAYGRLDALCNVAGVIFMANTPEMTVADWNTTVAVNLSAPFHLIQAAIPYLLAAEGSVVNVTSAAAFIGEAYLAAYCATKAGVLNMTKALAMEYMHRSIRFNAVAPGGMATGMMAAFRLPEGKRPVRVLAQASR